MFILLRGKKILDTNYSCDYATPHLMRRVHLYLEDNIKTETERESTEREKLAEKNRESTAKPQ